MEEENAIGLSTSGSFDRNLEEVSGGQDDQDNTMEERGETNLGKKQLTLSQVGVSIKNKKVRTETKDSTIVSKDYTFELAVSKYGRSIKHEEGVQECIDQVKKFIVGRKIEEILTEEER